MSDDVAASSSSPCHGQWTAMTTACPLCASLVLAKPPNVCKHGGACSGAWRGGGGGERRWPRSYAIANGPDQGFQVSSSSGGEDDYSHAPRSSVIRAVVPVVVCVWGRVRGGSRWRAGPW